MAGASGQADLPGEVDLDRLGNVLRSTVSAQAYRLAVLLSAVEVSLPIARIVMHELMPHARLAHLAELIAAGVLKAARLPAPGVASAAVGAGAPLPTAAPGSRADRSQIALTFAPGLRELLQRSLTVTMTLQVWRAVAPYLEATHGLRRFSLLLQPPHAELDAAAGADELREGLQAITADLADRLGLVPSPAADWPPNSERPIVGAAGGPANAPTALSSGLEGHTMTGSGGGSRLVARSVYLRQVEQIFPFDLVGRDAELADLEAFCAGVGGGSYMWWQGPAWAGKSALMAWFVLHPPADVQVVSFFITARFAGQGDRTAFLEVMLDQLADLAGKPVPDALTESNSQAWFCSCWPTPPPRPLSRASGWYCWWTGWMRTGASPATRTGTASRRCCLLSRRRACGSSWPGAPTPPCQPMCRRGIPCGTRASCAS